MRPQLKCRTEGHFTIYFLCPKCHEPNTQRLNKSNLNWIPNSRCLGCRDMVSIQALLTSCNPYDHNNLYLHCVEYICDECGRTNFIRNAIQHEATFTRPSEDPSELWKPPEDRPQNKLYVSGSQLPVHAECDYCDEPHDIVY